MDFKETKFEIRFNTKENAFAFAESVNKTDIRLLGTPKIRPSLPEFRGQVCHETSVWVQCFSLADRIRVQAMSKIANGRKYKTPDSLTHYVCNE